jgi:hypothetical protein
VEGPAQRCAGHCGSTRGPVPWGIDSQIDTGDFDLISVETDFVRPLRQTLTPKERTSIQLPH